MGKLHNTYHRDKTLEALKINHYLDSLQETWLLETPDDQLCPKYQSIKKQLQTRKRTKN